MRWIDFEDKKPTQPSKGWEKPWSQAKWDAWLNESNRLLGEVTALHLEYVTLRDAGKHDEADVKLKERNKFIDDNSPHWGKLKPWLFALSHGKCWFTEAKDIASHQDVEHFRPKKVALDINGVEQDGYWWLAFDYSNFRAAGNVPNRKKGGWFPLHQVSHRSLHDARCEESEMPHLLDPIRKCDADLVAFDEEGNAIPIPGATAWERERVLVSVERLKLNAHDALPEERRLVWRKTSSAIESFLKAAKAFDPEINPQPLSTMEERAREIYELTRPEAPLSSVARWCVLFRNIPRLSKLVY